MSAMLSMGVDDMSILNDSKKIVKNPESYLKSVVKNKVSFPSASESVLETSPSTTEHKSQKDDFVEALPDEDLAEELPDF